MSKIKNWALRKAVALQTRDEEGQGMVEYGLIITLVALVAAGGFTLLGTNLETFIGGISF